MPSPPERRSGMMTMRKGKMESVASSSITKRRSIQALAAFFVVYFFVLYNVPFSFICDDIATSQSFPSSSFPTTKLVGDVITRTRPLEEQVDFVISAPARPRTLHLKVPVPPAPATSSKPKSLSLSSSSWTRRKLQVSGLVFHHMNAMGPTSELDKVVGNAWETGMTVFAELESGTFEGEEIDRNQTMEEKCPHSMVMSELEFIRNASVLVLPCGLTLGSHITLIAKPNKAHPEVTPKIAMPKEGNQATLVSQFMIELQGLKTVDGEDPPRILHFNPRLKGDWSGKPMIELNTCYRMQWGIAHRCDGWKSRADEETVDGLVKCEKWIRDDDIHSEESKTKWWLNRLISGTRKVQIEWPYPFVEDKVFVLTLSAGLEGYHVDVNGRHIASFPYRTGFVLEDATGLSVSGDIQVKSVFSGSLPTTHPTFSPLKHLEISSQWQAPALPPDGAVELFIGILSAGNHFAERMAVRKSWMQSITKSRNMVARFFVAMHGRKEVNVDLKREAEFFGDIVIVPFMDSYDLVVLKTVAICEYGARALSAKYIMKCDDDTFVKIDSVMMEVKKVPSGNSLYIGNINYHHKPLRNGKWSVTYEEWPEEDYPPYANGPGYVISSDIAHFIISNFEKRTLRLFKMEDVSMGMWIEQFNNTRSVQYVHDLRFCQFGCFDGYFTAHYQSPRQMICMWDKLNQGKAECCNF